MGEKEAQPDKGHFDVPMIRDFLELMHLELRVLLQENTTLKPGQSCPELRDELRQAYQKYHCSGLIPAAVIDNDMADEDAERRARTLFRKDRAAEAQASLTALDTLGNHFEVALKSLSGNNLGVYYQCKVSDILKWHEGTDRPQQPDE